MKHCVHESDRAPGLMLGHDVEIGSDVEIGAHVVIHSGTVIGDGCTIQDGAVLGKQPKLSSRSRATAADELPALVLEPGVAVCTGAVLFAGARVGRDTVIGDATQLRERSTVGAESVVGRGTALENDVTVGDRVKIQTNCYITAFTAIEDEAFVAPGVVTTNDDTMGRHGKPFDLRGATLRRRCRVGGGVVLVPGVEIGEEAFVAAGAVVTADVAPRAVVMGVPARAVREVPDDDLWERWSDA